MSFSIRPARESDVATLLVLLAVLSGCDGYDSDYFPYRMTGLNVWVSNNTNDNVVFGGFVEGSYFNRTEALANCAARARATAQQHHLEAWSYVCCTVTSSDICVTKVR